MHAGGGPIEWLDGEHGSFNAEWHKVWQWFSHKAAESIVAGAGIKRRQRHDVHPVSERNGDRGNFPRLRYKFFRGQFFGFSIQEFIRTA
jgi:hypothetical protein